MILKRIKVNVGDVIVTNCYIVQDEETKETMVIDPGGETDKIIDMLETLNSKVKYILLTHCHADHISGVNDIKNKFGGQILIHVKDEPGLHDNSLNLSFYIHAPEVFVYADSRLNDGDLLHVGNIEFKVIHTPGHTCGGISLYCEREKLVFSGDTLFRGSWGRSDLPTSSFETIIESITNKLLTLPEDTIVYPGHGRATIIKEEKPIYLELKREY